MLQLLEQLGAQPCSQRSVPTGIRWQPGLHLIPASNRGASLQIPRFRRRGSNGVCSPGIMIILIGGTQENVQD